jgi:hypothetical protein
VKLTPYFDTALFHGEFRAPTTVSELRFHTINPLTIEALMTIDKLSGIIQANTILLACVLRNLSPDVLDRVEAAFTEESEKAIADFLNRPVPDPSLDSMLEHIAKIKMVLARP